MNSSEITTATITAVSGSDPAWEYSIAFGLNNMTHGASGITTSDLWSIRYASEGFSLRPAPVGSIWPMVRVGDQIRVWIREEPDIVDCSELGGA